MTRLLSCLGVAMLISCTDLSQPRAYQCTQPSDCVAPWVCLRDNYCHDPDVGAPVDCLASSECTGGWFCGKDERCHDPDLGAALSCDVDDQCPTGWQCNVAGTCVDVSALAPLTPPAAPSGDVVLHSPWVDPSPMVRAMPMTRVLVEGQPSKLLGAGRVVDGGVDVTFAAVSEAGAVMVPRVHFPLPGPVADFAVLPDALWVQWPDGTSSLINDSGMLPMGLAGRDPVGVSFVRDAQGSAFDVSPRGFVLRQANQLVFFGTDGGVQKVLPAAYSAAPQFITDSGVPIFSVIQPTGLNQGLGEVLRRDDDPQSGVAQLVDGRRYGQVITDPEGRLFTRQLGDGWWPEVSPQTMSCTDQDALGVGVADGAFVMLCRGADGTEYLQRQQGASQQVLFARPSIASHQVSSGYVREEHNGALALSDDLVSEFLEVLPSAPQGLGIIALDDDGRPDTPAIVQLLAAAPTALFGKRLVDRDGTGNGEQGLRWIAPPGQVRGFNSELDALILEGGSVVRGSDVAFLMEGNPTFTAAQTQVLDAGVDDGQWLVVTTDSLYAAEVRPMAWAVPMPELIRPAPGFPIQSLALRPSETLLFEGWAVANNQLFRVTASSATRWKSTPLSLTELDAVGVWFNDTTALVGTDTGEVLRLPERFVVSDPLPDEALSYASTCNVTLATTPDGVFALTGNGPRFTWQRLAALDDPNPHRPGAGLVEPRVQVVKGRLFVSDALGTVVEVPTACTPQ